MISILVFLLLAFVIPILLMSGPVTQVNFVGLTAMGAVIYGAWRIALSLRSRSEPMLYSIFGVFVYMNYGLASLLQGCLNIFPWPGTYLPSNIIDGNLIAIIGCISFEIGIFIAQKVSSHKTQKYERLISFSLMRWLVPLGFCATIGLFVFSGWYRAVFAYRGVAGAIAAEGALELLAGSAQAQMMTTATLRSLPLFLTIAVGLLLIARSKDTSIRTYFSSRYLVCALIVFGGISLILANPISAARYWQATVGTALLVLFFKFVKLDGRKWMPVMLLLAYLFIFPAADAFRRSFSMEEIHNFYKEGVWGNVKSSLLTADYDAFQQTMNSVEYVELESYQWGKQILGSFLFFVPRSVWHGKPEPSGIMVAQTAGYSFTNLSCPLWAEGFLDYGYIGTFLLLSLFGLGVGSVECAAMRLKLDSSAYRLFVILFTGYEVFFLRGTLMVAVAYFSVTFIFVLVVQRKNYFVPLRRRRMLLNSRLNN